MTPAPIARLFPSRPRRVLRRTPVLLLAVLALMPALPTLAQSRGGDTSAVSVSQALADGLTRRALGLLSAPTGEEVEPVRDALEAVGRPGGDAAAVPAASDVAAELLALATGLTPRDGERHRLAALLAESRGDTAGTRAALAAYLRSRPDDDAAMLKLILLRLERDETLDGRLTAIERILDSSSDGRTLTRPLRSQLAWLAAEASAELGDRQRSLKWLGQAAKLDRANVDAARATYGVMAGLKKGPKQRGAAAMNWIRAAPIDPEARLSLATILAEEAAYLDAATQFQMAARLSGGAALPWPSYRAWALSVGATGNTEAALNLIDSIAAATASADPEAAAADPDAGLPLEFELLRLTLLGGADHQRRGRDDVAVTESFDRVVRLLARERASAVPAEVPAVVADLAWVTAVYGPEERLTRVEPLLETLDIDDPLRDRALGWLHLRRGEERLAQEALERVPEDPMARVGLGLLLGTDNPGRVRFLLEVADEDPQSLAALIATDELRRLESTPRPTLAGQTLLDLMQQTGQDLWRLDLVAAPWLTLRADVMPRSARVFEPVTLRLRLRNTSSLPVALAHGDTVNPQVLVRIGLFRDGQPYAALPVQVVDIDRRLTLLPNETLVVDHRLDWGELGRLATAEPEANYSYAAELVLDPRATPGGSTASGPLGISTTLRGQQIGGAPLNDQTVRGWLDTLSGGVAGSETPEAVALARLAMVGDGRGNLQIAPELSDEIASLLEERATSYDDLRLAWMLWNLDATDGEASPYQRIFDRARRSDDAASRAALLLQHVADPGASALDAALRSGPPATAALARAWRAVLEARAGAGTPTGFGATSR